MLLGFTQVPASPRKVCDENEIKKKQCVCKNVFGRRREIIGCVWETRAMDISTSFKSMIVDRVKVLFV